MSWIIGVDVGGTFTDFCARNNNSGETLIHKRPSTPNDPAIAILNGLDEIKLKFINRKNFKFLDWRMALQLQLMLCYKEKVENWH